MKQTVGVVLATYNGENFLDEQLQSIFNQTLLPDKVVIVDDCSTDGSMRIAEKWVQRHQETIEITNMLKILDLFAISNEASLFATPISSPCAIKMTSGTLTN